MLININQYARYEHKNNAQTTLINETVVKTLTAINNETVRQHNDKSIMGYKAAESVLTVRK